MKKKTIPMIIIIFSIVFIGLRADEQAVSQTRNGKFACFNSQGINDNSYSIVEFRHNTLERVLERECDKKYPFHFEKIDVNSYVTCCVKK